MSELSELIIKTALTALILGGAGFGVADVSSRGKAQTWGDETWEPFVGVASVFTVVVSAIVASITVIWS